VTQPPAGWVGVDAVLVIGAVERVEFPRVGELELPAFKEHDRDIDPAIAGLVDAVAHTVEIRRIERAQVKLGLAIGGEASAGPGPRLRLAVFGHASRLGVGPLGRFPAPETEKVVPVPREKVEISVVVESWRRIVTTVLAVAVVLEVVPVVRANEEDRVL